MNINEIELACYAILIIDLSADIADKVLESVKTIAMSSTQSQSSNTEKPKVSDSIKNIAKKEKEEKLKKVLFWLGIIAKVNSFSDQMFERR